MSDEGYSWLITWRECLAVLCLWAAVSVDLGAFISLVFATGTVANILLALDYRWNRDREYKQIKRADDL